MVVMLVASAALAPAYYLLQGEQGHANMHLVGMLAVLAGPPLLVVAVSLAWHCSAGENVSPPPARSVSEGYLSAKLALPHSPC